MVNRYTVSRVGDSSDKSASVEIITTMGWNDYHWCFGILGDSFLVGFGNTGRIIRKVKMGGNALSVTTTRLPAKLYGMTADYVITKLDAAFIGRRKAVIPSYAGKPDFGDMDVLVAGGVGYDPRHAAAFLEATEAVHNGDVTSLGLRIKEGVFQVDLIKVPAESFDFALRYFAMNDLGNLLGRIAHKAGFKLGHLGLLYSLRDTDRTDHVIAELVVTQNWDEAITLLGYDPAAYKKGFKGGFQQMVDIFNFVVSSPYCNKDIYLLENHNAKARECDRKRKTYMAFLDWLDSVQDNRMLRYDWSNKESVRQKFLGEALDRFPTFHASYLQSLEDWRIERACHAKFNGRLVGEITGLAGKELGVLIQRIHESFDDKASMQNWILEANDVEMRELVQRFHSEVYKQH